MPECPKPDHAVDKQEAFASSLWVMVAAVANDVERMKKKNRVSLESGRV
jgi:hypothetical protein